jgi:hypothetical protein
VVVAPVFALLDFDNAFKLISTDSMSVFYGVIAPAKSDNFALIYIQVEFVPHVPFLQSSMFLITYLLT